MSGYKTYIIGILVFIVGGVMALGIIPKDLGEMIIVFLAGLGAMAMRAAISKGPRNGGLG